MLRDNKVDIRQIMGMHTDTKEIQIKNNKNENRGAFKTNDMI